MLEKYRITNVDTFFLTFIGAWASTNQELWKHPTIAIFIIVGTLCFSTVLAQIRFYLDTKEKMFSAIFVVGILILTFIVGYLINCDKKILNDTDRLILAACSTIWTLNIIGEFVASRKAYIPVNIPQTESNKGSM